MKKEEEKIVSLEVCTNCGRAADEVGLIIHTESKKHPESTICNICLGELNVKAESFMGISEDDEEAELEVMPVSELRESLLGYVKGQSQIIKRLSTAVWRHNTVIEINKRNIDKGEELLGKVNILMIGPSGCGKTFTGEMLAQIINRTCIISDAASLVPPGIRGENPETILTRLFLHSGEILSVAKRGLVVLDEVDKLAVRNSDKDEGMLKEVQASLLCMLNGGTSLVSTDVSNSDTREKVMFNTRENLFIATGAFSGLTKVIAKRTGYNQNKPGFGTGGGKKKKTENEILKMVTREDLVKYGLLPEFVNRFHLILVCNELTGEDLIDILENSPKSMIKEWQSILGYENKELIFTKGAISTIAEKAIKEKTGARGLRTIVEDIMQKTIEDKDEITIDYSGFIVNSEAVNKGQADLIANKKDK